MQKISREKAIERVIILTNEIARSRQVRNLFRFAKTGHRKELDEKTSVFENSKLYRKIVVFDQQFPDGPLYISNKKEDIKAYQSSNLKPLNFKINPKALFFLILSMPTHEESDFFEDYKDFASLLWKSGEKELSEYIQNYWLKGGIADILWTIFDQDD